MILKLLAILLATSTAFAQVDVLTRRVDNSRSGVNSHESVLTQDAVRTRFGKLWTLFADAKIMAQPLYVSNLVVPASSIIGTTAKAKCASGCNAVLFATMKGTIYAYMADQKPTTASDTLLWATYFERWDRLQVPSNRATERQRRLRYVGGRRPLVGNFRDTRDRPIQQFVLCRELD